MLLSQMKKWMIVNDLHFFTTKIARRVAESKSHQHLWIVKIYKLYESKRKNAKEKKLERNKKWWRSRRMWNGTERLTYEYYYSIALQLFNNFECGAKLFTRSTKFDRTINGF